MSLNTSLVKFLNRIKFFIFFSLLCLLSFLILLFVYKFFLIKNIQLVSDKEFFLTNKDELINKSLLFANQDQITKEIIKENFLLKTAVVEKVWPDIAPIFSVPHNEKDYNKLVTLLDSLIDEVGNNENHPLSSLMRR